MSTLSSRHPSTWLMVVEMSPPVSLVTPPRDTFRWESLSAALLNTPTTTGVNKLQGDFILNKPGTAQVGANHKK